MQIGDGSSYRSQPEYLHVQYMVYIVQRKLTSTRLLNFQLINSIFLSFTLISFPSTLYTPSYLFERSSGHRDQREHNDSPAKSSQGVSSPSPTRTQAHLIPISLPSPEMSTLQSSNRIPPISYHHPNLKDQYYQRQTWAV
jgi:hypothetical protein